MDEAGTGVAIGVARARAKSAAVAKRSAGALARTRWRAWSTPSGTVSRSRRAEGTGSMNRLAMIAWGVVPMYGGSPANIS